MFVLPVLLLPLVLALAIYRLYQIPRRLRSGELRRPVRHRAMWLAAGSFAYVALLAYTAFLGYSLIHLLMVDGNRATAYASMLVYVLAYPCVYVGAAWVFYYAWIPASRARG